MVYVIGEVRILKIKANKEDFYNSNKDIQYLE